MRKEGGFTLIELLIVIIIIGILAAIAIPMFLSQRDKAKDAAVKEGVHSIQVGVESYAVDNNDAYPVGDQALTNGCCSCRTYVDNWPKNPWTNADMVDRRTYRGRLPTDTVWRRLDAPSRSPATCPSTGTFTVP